MARKKKLKKVEKVEYDDELFDGPSRTTIKLDLKDRQTAVANWPDLPLSQLKTMPLDEHLVEQLLHARELKADSGRRRLLRYIAKHVDDQDFAAVEAHLADAQQTSLAAVKREKACEQWRENMLLSDDAVTEFFAKYSNAEHQMVRQTVKQARSEVERNAVGGNIPPVAQRKLFKMLRETVAEAEENEY